MSPLVLVGLLFLAAPEPKRINLDLKDAEIENVLRLFADIGKLNVVAGDQVKGKVSVKFTNVPWPEALDTILSAKGLGYTKTDNVIVVDTLENLAARAPRPALASPERVTVLIPVHYAKAQDLVPIVRGLLSKDGTVTVDARTNSLIVTDAKVDLERMQAALQK